MTSLEFARWRLAAIWFIGSAINFILLVGQSLSGLFLSDVEKAWAWAIPNIIPTLSLMVSVFSAYALVQDAGEDKYVVRTNFFRLSCGLSVFYLFNVLLVIVMSPISARFGVVARDPVAVMHLSNFWLGPLQGVTAAVIAALFFTKTEK